MTNRGPWNQRNILVTTCPGSNPIFLWCKKHSLLLSDYSISTRHEELHIWKTWAQSKLSLTPFLTFKTTHSLASSYLFSLLSLYSNLKNQSPTRLPLLYTISGCQRRGADGVGWCCRTGLMTAASVPLTRMVWSGWGREWAHWHSQPTAPPAAPACLHAPSWALIHGTASIWPSLKECLNIQSPPLVSSSLYSLLTNLILLPFVWWLCSGF